MCRQAIWFMLNFRSVCVERRMITRFLSAFLLWLALLVHVSCSSDNTRSNRTQAAEAKSFQAYDIAGKRHSFSEWIGRQPVVLKFCGTWCGPCRREVPAQVLLHKE